MTKRYNDKIIVPSGCLKERCGLYTPTMGRPAMTNRAVEHAIQESGPIEATQPGESEEVCHDPKCEARFTVRGYADYTFESRLIGACGKVIALNGSPVSSKS